MKPRNTFIVVALFGVLLAYVYLVEVNKTPEQLGTPTPVAPYVLQLGAGNVKTIQVTDARAPREVVLSRTDKGWQLNKPVEKAADTRGVDSALSSLTNLQASRVLTNVTDLAPFGLVTATLEVRLVMTDTVPYALTVGSKTLDNSSYYVTYTGDKTRVFLVSAFVIDELKKWLDAPPYEPTPTPTSTPTVPITATITTTQTITVPSVVTTPTTAPPLSVPTLAPTPVDTPKP